MKKIIALILTISFLFGSIVTSFSNTTNTKFADNKDIADYAKNAVNWAVNNNIIAGYENNTFRPRVEMQEAHWTIILTRYVSLGQVPAAKGNEHWADPAYRVAQDLLLPFKGLNSANVRNNAINRGDVARTIAAAFGFNLNLEQAVEFMYDNEFSAGTNPNLRNYSTYGVNSSLTRQDAVVFIQRINDLVAQRGGVNYRGTFYPIQIGSVPGIKNGGRTFTTQPDFTRFAIKSTNETISDVVVLVRDNKPEIRLKTTNALTHKVTNLPSTDKSVTPDRLVFDFDNAKFDITNKSKLLSNNTMAIDINNEIVRRVRASQFEVNPFKTRIVLEVNTFSNYRVFYDEENKEMVISFNLTDAPPINRGQDRTYGTLNSINLNYVQNREVLSIDGLSIDDINVTTLEFPKRLVIDIKNVEVATSLLNSNTMNFNGRVGKVVRVSQFQPEQNYANTDKVARVVIDLSENVDTKDFTFEISKNNLAIYFEKANQAVIYTETGTSNSTLTLSANQITNYTTNYDQFSNILSIFVPKNDINLAPTLTSINDSYIQHINIADLSDQFRVEIKLKNRIEHMILTPLNTKELTIQFNRSATKYSDILIVIDPGHGGTQPGAVSPNLRLFESHIVLDVSHRLNNMLLNAGFQTYMTRVGDTTVGLQERADIANMLNADLFVSVHANAFTRPDVNGIETHYYPSEKNPEDFRDNKTVAQIFQNEMLKSLKGNNRGIFARENIVVLRETKMPAVLCELGYLTNPIEEARLATDDYRQKSAEAMFNAIIKYFE